ncbi:MAG: hypothetical protein AAFR93_17655 [Pseudomonadota bacterium]
MFTNILFVDQWRRLLRFTLLAVSLAFATPTFASPVTYDFTAKIDLIDRFGDTTALESGLAGLGVGAEVTGSFSYDPNTPDRDDDDFFGDYALTDFTVDLDAFNAFNANLSILGGNDIGIELPAPEFVNDPFDPLDPNISFYSINNNARGGSLDFAVGAQSPVTSIAIDFEAPTPTSDALPAQLPFEDSLGPILFRVFLESEGYRTDEDLFFGPVFLAALSAEGEITQIALRTDEVTPVPLPASSLLLLGGIGLLAGLKRRGA